MKTENFNMIDFELIKRGLESRLDKEKEMLRHSNEQEETEELEYNIICIKQLIYNLNKLGGENVTLIFKKEQVVCRENNTKINS